MRKGIQVDRSTVLGFVVPALLVASGGALGPTPMAAQDVEVSPDGSFHASSPAHAMDFSSDGRFLLTGHADGSLSVRDLQAGDEVLRVTAGERTPRYVTFLAGDTAVARVSEDGTARLYPLAPGDPAPEPLTELRPSAEPLAVALDAARRYLAMATEDEEVEVFDLSEGRRLGSIDAGEDLDDLLHLGFDRQGRQLMALTERGEVTAWNPVTRETLRRVTLHGEELHGSRTVVHAAGADRNANILVLALEEAALPRGGVRGRARPGDLEREDQLLVFDWHSGVRITGLPLAGGPPDLLAVGPGNDHAVVAHDSEVRLTDLRAGEPGASLSMSAAVTALSLSPDDDRLAVASEDGEVTFWSLEYRGPVALEDLDDAPPGLSGRLTVVGEDEPVIEPDSPLTMAILPFDDPEGDGRMSRMVAELLTTQLANLDHLTLVERLRVDDILQEQELQEQGITEADGLELGRLLNADYVLVGNLGTSGTTQTVSARLLRVETGETVAGRQVLCLECRAQDLFDAIHLLGETIAR